MRLRIASCRFRSSELLLYGVCVCVCVGGGGGGIKMSLPQIDGHRHVLHGTPENGPYIYIFP